jgi:hypothetical protein
MGRSSQVTTIGYARSVRCRNSVVQFHRPLMRARGIDVLAQLGKTVEHPTNSFPDESYSVVTNLLMGERDVRPLNSAIEPWAILMTRVQWR